MAEFCESCPFRGDCNGEITGARVQTRGTEPVDFVEEASNNLKGDLTSLQRAFNQFIVDREIDLNNRDEGSITRRRIVLLDDQGRKSEPITHLSGGLTDEQAAAVVARGIGVCRNPKIDQFEENPNVLLQPGDDGIREVVKCPVPGLYEPWMSNDIVEQRFNLVEIK